MPNENGLSLTASLREHLNTPILLLSAKGEANARILGLEAGADDYMAKPFEPKELVLRINSILRRIPKQDADETAAKTLYMGNIYYDTKRNELWNGQTPIKLTATETTLMRIFCNHAHSPVSRSKLLEELSRNGVQSQERAVDVQITRLRRKLERNPKIPRYLQTVRGDGYMLNPD